MRSDLRFRWLWRLLGVGLVAAVWYLSLTGNPPATGVAGSDKLGHGLAYALQAFWFCCLFERRHWRWVVLWFVSQGVLLEVLQGVSGLRHPEVADAVANTAGVVVGCLLASLVYRFLPTVEAEVVV